MPETCLSRLKSDDIVKQRRRTWLLALMGPVPRSSDGPLLLRTAGPYLDRPKEALYYQQARATFCPGPIMTLGRNGFRGDFFLEFIVDIITKIT